MKGKSQEKFFDKLDEMRLTPYKIEEEDYSSSPSTTSKCAQGTLGKLTVKRAPQPQTAFCSKYAPPATT
jgi:hypothetical protein